MCNFLNEIRSIYEVNPVETFWIFIEDEGFGFKEKNTDRIFERLNPKSLEEMYARMEDYAKTMDWLKKPMGRSSFRVKY